ncbi:MAG: 50S ribosomal protein L18 [Candidatus Aenigmatarchaeota archaeon]
MHRRRREKKTDYKQRLGLLKSGKLRFVVRRHNNSTVAQLVDWEEEGDKTVLQANSRDLENFNWNGHKANLPAAYLTGYLLGKKAKDEGIEEAILDIGLQENTTENRIYSAAKGMIDAGVEVPIGERMLPAEGRIRGEHIENYAEQMSEGEKKEHFSKLIENGFDPAETTQNFEKTKENINKKFGE